MDRYSFADKNVLITGATGGLGSELARLLAREGAQLVVTSRSQAALDELIASLPERARVHAVIADLGVPGVAKRLAEAALTAVGQVDALFNNAGIGYFALLEEATEENIRHLFEVNTFSPTSLMKALVPSMKARRAGRIVNIVSAAGRVPIPTVSVYGGSKSALAVMANTMRLELEPFGIDIINVYPGTTDSAFEENALREEDRPGLCPTERCGVPRTEMAKRVLAAAKGRSGEVWLEVQGKWLSAASLIFPSYVDRKLSTVRDRAVDKNSLRKRRRRLLQVESAIACNLRCVMCPWVEIRSKAANRGLMTEEIWAAIRPHLKDVASVDLTGGGEPLLQPNLARWMAEASAAGCETGILTNGLLLNRETVEKLMDAGWDWLCVSMDGATQELYEKIRKGSDYRIVTENLARVGKLRKNGKPKTMITFVLMNINFHEVEEIVWLAHRLGVDQVNFKQCDVIRGEYGKGFGLFGSEETRELKKVAKELNRALALARKLRIKTTSFPFTPSEKPVCDQDPRDSMFIRYDGSVGPCINLAVGGPATFLGAPVTMPQIIYGNVTENDLWDLWETDSCRLYRTRFEERVKAYEKVFVDSLTGGLRLPRERLVEKAGEAMPEAADGCKVCHYLYDL